MYDYYQNKGIGTRGNLNLHWQAGWSGADGNITSTRSAIVCRITTKDHKLCLPVIICHTLVLHSPHLSRQLGVSCPGHTGHGRPTHIVPLRALCLLTQPVPLDQSLWIKDHQLAPVLLTQCGTQRTPQPGVLRPVYQPLLQAKTISLDTGHSRCAQTTAFRPVII